MSTLSTTLIVLVVAVLAGVGLYNLIQYRRTAPTPREASRARGDDAAAAASIPGLARTEPSLGTFDLPLHGESTDLADNVDPDSLPDEMARISDLNKVVAQAPSRTGDAGTDAGRRAAAPSPGAGTDAGTGAGMAPAAGPRGETGAAVERGGIAARSPAGGAGVGAAADSSRDGGAADLASRGADAGGGAPQPADGDPASGATGIVAGSDRGGGPRGKGAASGGGVTTAKGGDMMGAGAAGGTDRGDRSAGETPLAASILTPVADCIVDIRLRQPYPAERLLGLSQSLRRVGAKPVLFEGWYESRGHGAWVPIAPGQPSTAYGLIRAGVLLANRHGPLNAMEFAEFTTGLGTLIEQLSASARLPEMAPVLEKARALDDACIELDAQIGLNVDANEPLSPSDLERLAREQRLVERGSNRYARLGPAGEVMFSVSQVEQPNRVTFLLDVPRAPAALQPWQQLVECAKASAVRLQGSLVDDEGRPLGDSMLEQIGVQLAGRAEALELAGFPPGSPLALRLFN